MNRLNRAADHEYSSLRTDVTGYVAIDNTRALTILAFRGSSSVRNFVADANFVAKPTDICPSCTAHNGFWDSWVEARPGVLAALKTAAASHPANRVVVTGHSLGGAIADLAAAEIRKSGITADLYTYGAPRIAGKVLSDFITNQNKGGNFRVTHKVSNHGIELGPTLSDLGTAERSSTETTTSTPWFRAYFAGVLHHQPQQRRTYSERYHSVQWIHQSSW